MHFVACAASPVKGFTKPTNYAFLDVTMPIVVVVGHNYTIVKLFKFYKIILSAIVIILKSCDELAPYTSLSKYDMSKSVNDWTLKCFLFETVVVPSF